MPNNVGSNQKVLDQIRKATFEKDSAKRHQLLWQNGESIRHYLSSFILDGMDNDFTRQYVNDALARYFHTLDLLPFNDRLDILELGSNPYFFSILLNRFHDYKVSYTNFFSLNVYDADISKGRQRLISKTYDEMYTFDYDIFNIELSDYPYDSESYDLVLFCEILEHLIVDPLKVFFKLRKIIKKGGKLLITTPNAVRLINVAYLLSGCNFFDIYHPQNGIYGRHNREFTLEEVVNLLEDNGYSIIKAVTLDRYDYNRIPIFTNSYESHKQIQYTKDELIKHLKNTGACIENRGDNIYILAEKV